MVLTFKDYTISGTPQEIKEFIEMVETKTTLSTNLSGVVIENSQPIICPHCGSTNVQYMYGTGLLTTNEYQNSCHYLCKDCHKEFDI